MPCTVTHGHGHFPKQGGTRAGARGTVSVLAKPPCCALMSVENSLFGWKSGGGTRNPTPVTLGEELNACFAGKNFPLPTGEVTSEPYFPFHTGTRASGTERSPGPGGATGWGGCSEPLATGGPEPQRHKWSRGKWKQPEAVSGLGAVCL